MKFLTDTLSGFLHWLNLFTNNFGFSIVIFAFIIKVILFPLDLYNFLQEKKLKSIQEKTKEIFKNIKNDPQQQLEVLSSLYKDLNYHPFLYFFLQFIQIPLFLAIFFMLKNITASLTAEEFLNIKLNQPSLILALTTIILQLIFIQQIPREQRKFSYLFLGLVALIIINFPALFNLYWLTNLLLTFLERQIFSFYEKKFVTQSIDKEKTL